MSEHWDFYFTTMEEQPASIFLDMGIEEEVPVPNRTWMLWARVLFQHLREDGLSDGAESDTLYEIEDVIGGAVADAVGAELVGRVTHNGGRSFHYYGSEFAGFEEAVSRAMTAFPDYEWESGTMQDPDWEFYRDVLYPTPEDQQCMQNRQVIEVLQEHGDTLEQERPVSHWAYFAEEGSRKRFVKAVEKLGYKVENQTTSDDADNPHPLGVMFERVDLVDWGSINDVTLELFELAHSLSGYYDGWETVLIKE